MHLLVTMWSLAPPAISYKTGKGEDLLINDMDWYRSVGGYGDLNMVAVLCLRCAPDPNRRLQSVRLIRTASQIPTQTVLSLLGATGVRSTTN